MTPFEKHEFIGSTKLNAFDLGSNIYIWVLTFCNELMLGGGGLMDADISIPDDFLANIIVLRNKL